MKDSFVTPRERKAPFIGRRVVRRPEFFGPELAPPADADEQTRLLAYLGRATWQPVPTAED